MKYVEAHNGKPINWHAELHDIKKLYWEAKKENTVDKWREYDAKLDYLKMHSSSWVTCACGNQCVIFERNRHGQPKDYHLSELGQNFYMDIKMEEFDVAEETLIEIEKRSSYLLENVYAGIQPLAVSPLILI